MATASPMPVLAPDMSAIVCLGDMSFVFRCGAQAISDAVLEYESYESNEDGKFDDGRFDRIEVRVFLVIIDSFPRPFSPSYK